jgi:pseudoazurin
MSPARGMLSARCPKVAVALCWGASLAAVGVAPAVAREYEIGTRGNQWAPAVLFIAPGDTVVWRGMSGHETELFDGMSPPQADYWMSALGEEGFSVTFSTEGAYIYKCHTHLSAGMVGAIVVGDGPPQNLEAIDAAVRELDVGRAFVQRIVERMKREWRRRSGQ